MNKVGTSIEGEPARSVKQVAYDRFREALFAGHLRSGQLVSQKELVSLLGLSIGALRELLPRLQSEGLLNVLPQRGIQITLIDLPMIRDAFQMRMALEREAVLTAARKLPEDVLLEQKRLHTEVLERLRTEPSSELFHEGQRIDDGFHHLLIQATGNEILIQAHSVNSIRIRLIKRDRITLTAAVLPSAFGDHLAVIEALLARDAHAAMDAMERHIMHARERAMEL